MKARINVRNAFAVLQYLFRKGRDLSGFKLPDYMYEQVIWRRTQIMKNSPLCWEEGHCVVCGCDVLGKSMEDRACAISEDPELLAAGDTPCYPEMMNKYNWEKYKKLHDIKLFN